jgi:hypothetical protein
LPVILFHKIPLLYFKKRLQLLFIKECVVEFVGESVNEVNVKADNRKKYMTDVINVNEV